MTKKYAIYCLLLCFACAMSCNSSTVFDSSNGAIEKENDSLYAELSLVPNENIFHKIYEKRGITSCQVTSSEFENGAVVAEYVQSIETYDRWGYATLRTVYAEDDSLPFCIVKYEYDALQRIISEEWNWKDLGSFERSEYVYTDKLIEMKDFYKDSVLLEYQLESKTQIKYDQNKIDLLLGENNDTLSYFIHEQEKSAQYSPNKVLEAKYKNGLIVEFTEDGKVTTLDRDELGNILEIKSYDIGGNLIYRIINEYDDGLLVKTLSEFGDGEIMSILAYEYFD